MTDTDTNPTWDAVMRRNSRLQVQNHHKPNTKTRDRDRRDSTVYVKLGQEACNTYYTPNNLPVIHDHCNDSSWMDFLQILVHQHAKTIVHLQELSTEVEKLKDFRSSFISSLTADLVKSSSAGPSDLHHHLSQSKDVWTSPNKLIDSGFSTETKESANQKEEEDPLYSLLDLIQTKVSNSVSTNSTHIATASCTTCHHHHHRINNGTIQSASKLGKLDLVLGFKNGIGENVHIPRDVIRAILRELDTVELQRQLLFAVANVKTLESQLSSFEVEGNSPRLASKYLALSHENELLRFKLKEQEIQLEGTKARLRILEKKTLVPIELPSPRLSLIPLDSLPKSTASATNLLTSTHLHPKSICMHSNLDIKISRTYGPSISPLPKDSTFKKDSASKCQTMAMSSSSILNIGRSPNLNNQCSAEIDLIDNETLCGPNLDQDEKHRVVVRPGHSRIPMRVMIPSPSPPVQTQQSISSKSPGSSMSSKSSIPIAVTRLKRNGSIGSGNGTSSDKRTNGKSKFWTWFAASSATSGS